METRDDAGYIPFGGGLLLQTADFFTPIVDDSCRFGQIAAANAFSDISAMGGDPIAAMNPLRFPSAIDLRILRDMLAGAQLKIVAARGRTCGGHAAQGGRPGGRESNREYLEGRVFAEGAVARDLRPLYDPQTSGGLLAAVPGDRAPQCGRALEEHGASGFVVGEVVEGNGVRITT